MEHLERDFLEMPGLHCLLVVLAASVLLFAGHSHAEDEEDAAAAPTSAEVRMRVSVPTIRIPFTKTPPTIDGRMEDDEWQNAAAYTGFWQDFGGGNFAYLATREKQATFWVTYDKEYLYFAHKSVVFPNGAWLKCKGKFKDVDGHPRYGILWDDHVEFVVTPTFDQKAHLTKGIFKFMINPIDTFSDFFVDWRDGPPNWDYGWESGCEVKGAWNEEAWVTEMRTPLKTFIYKYHDAKDEDGSPKVRVPIPDGTMWLSWGSRALDAGGSIAWLFSATHKGGWSGPSMRWIFDSKAVSAQVRELGYLFRDRIDLDIELKNHGDHSETVRAGVYVENDTELVFANTQQMYFEMVPGSMKKIRIKQENLGITPRDDAVWIDIRTASGKLIYQSQLMPFHHVLGVPDFKEVLIDGMKFYREPRKPFEYRFAYYPYKNTIFVWVDTDIYGVTDKVKSALEAKVVLESEDGATAHSMIIPLEAVEPGEGQKTWGGRMAHKLMTFPKLPAGRYRTTCLLFDKNKRIVAEQTSIFFEQRSFPWEHNTEGIEDICWEPYTPIQVAEGNRTLQTLMHTIELAPSGMPGQITIKGKEKNPAFGPQLRAPIRLEATVGKERLAYEPKTELKQTKSWESEVAFETTGTCGPVSTRSRVQYECDGFMLYDLYYQTGGRSLDTLELVVELSGPVDLMTVNAQNRKFRPDCPKREGKVIWNSRDDADQRDLYYGNFNSHIFLGNGDRGFCWMAETDRGMKLLKENIASQVEKTEEGEYAMRIFLVNEPGPVPEERHVQFAFMTFPTKPKPASRRWINWHMEPAGGGPMVGDGANSRSIHLVNDEDYALYRPMLFVKDANKKPTDRKVRPYTTCNLICWDLPAYKSLTYTGEWSGRTDLRPKPISFNLQRGVQRRNPVTGRSWDTVFLRAEAFVDWCQSRVDNWVYWRSKQIRLAGVEGFWWDHFIYGAGSHDPVVGQAYFLPKEKRHRGGRLQQGFHYFHPRQFFKRFSRIVTKTGQRITSAHYGGFDSILNAPFQRDELNWEGAAGYSSGFHHLERYSVDFVRLCANNYTGLCGMIIDDINWTKVSGQNPAFDRANLASALLHDIGTDVGRFANRHLHRDVLQALNDFGYFEPGEVIQWVPYWRSRHLYRYGPVLGDPGAEEDFLGDEFITDEERKRSERNKKVLCSVYRNTKTKKALLILVNNQDQPIEDYLYVSDEVLDREPKVCHDVEADGVVDPSPLDKGDLNKETIPNTFGPVFIDRWQFRMLVVE